ncbi:hypothetical protein D9758_015354 [Tetrapyrgos nigripes]|uniref:WD40 repeat-like protein n=1 Tax=Tetrapyrgos nigripes TaxID=182062 RepID=A0A8H5CM20_9AGAR|nr:hypothetical protein D9758_015354 [Tetrapyrgos nigripes]
MMHKSKVVCYSISAHRAGSDPLVLGRHSNRAVSFFLTEPLSHYSMPSQLIWQPTSSITLRPDQYSDGISAMAFSVDGRFLAVASGRRTEIWNTRDESTAPCQTYIASTNTHCLLWFRDGHAFVTGHDGGRLYHNVFSDQGPVSNGFRQQGFYGKIKSMSIWRDALLLAAAEGQVQVWELESVSEGYRWNLLGLLPNPPPLRFRLPATANVAESVHWLSDYEILVSYEGIGVCRYMVQSLYPLEVYLDSCQVATGLIQDVCLPTKTFVVCDVTSNMYQLYTHADSQNPRSSTTFIPRSRLLNRVLPVSRAMFCTVDSILGASNGRLFLWDLSGSRVQTIDVEGSNGNLITNLACCFDTAFGCARLAAAFAKNQDYKVVFWKTVETTDN